MNSLAIRTRALRTSVAPMIDVTDPCFLRLLRLISPFGNHQLWTEMVHANMFSRGQVHLERPKLAQYIPIHDLSNFAHGTVVQIGASDPQDAYAAVRELRRLGIRHVNLNCGCPSRNVQMGSFGAVLMTKPDIAAGIVRAMVDAATENADELNPATHISVKCRIGIDEDESPEFLRRFMDSVFKAAGPVSFVLHARRAWLNGLSPEQNRSVPQLNHARAYEMAREFPQTQVFVNGGVDSVEKTLAHLQHADGVMIGRKIREDPWFLSALDQHVYGVHSDMLPTAEQVLSEYVRFANQMHSDYAMRYTVLARPLYALFSGRKGRTFRRILGQTILQAKASRDRPLYSIQFSEAVSDAIYTAEKEHQQNLGALVSDEEPIVNEAAASAVAADR
ncbi:hypothetical protein LPJ53_001231 [Coemansia erecta]|uniref:DUS-like FMN-binding domain-containing protein n=1 Tax=Coemansia erecta TaxID=147472 RepID=A0A9W8CUB8_9FUNG|nr:hypothetical protein LPJ53_001231 [Coemansia erecta]